MDMFEIALIIGALASMYGCYLAGHSTGKAKGMKIVWNMVINVSEQEDEPIHRDVVKRCLDNIKYEIFR